MKPKTVRARRGGNVIEAHSETTFGILPGTQILTLDGALPIEVLSPGDKIITRSSGVAMLKGIECGYKTCETVRVRAGSLGHDRPGMDTILPSKQKILIRDWRAQALYNEPQKLIEAQNLIDGEYLRLQPAARHMVFRMFFDEPQVVYADGLEVDCATASIRMMA
ncbi:Hint domain-containing protein [Thalassobius sp. Cn5-15]|uniref:Hint domain-containing protein n=1 Tax=Thalassobius sp. Cn5-15 TaxID=2917763 RepID=UPI001EF16F26|nr:Hint domain-containing protein [Thalassobius sp. Cn5-15]MCG7492510.1 Hint domain-containing protein [Thalassobius sp. Cn5-15]